MVQYLTHELAARKGDSASCVAARVHCKIRPIWMQTRSIRRSPDPAQAKKRAFKLALVSNSTARMVVSGEIPAVISMILAPALSNGSRADAAALKATIAGARRGHEGAGASALHWLNARMAANTGALVSPKTQAHQPGAGSINLDAIPTGWYGRFVNPQDIERPPSGGARSKLLRAAFSIIRQKGYAATSVDQLCARAGVTKGAFFHHFPSKDSLAVTAVHQWTRVTAAFFAAAPFHKFDDPLDRVLGYLDLRKSLLRGDVAEFTCLAGTMVQEAYGTHPDVRQACDASFDTHAARVESDIAEAMKRYGIRAPSWTADSLALHTQAVLQGAFILAKAKGSAAVAEASIEHLRRYVELLFRRPKKKASRKH
jgi:TetR/AcrR family transcriptional regulator, transcriptional repressor for nem operon